MERKSRFSEYRMDEASADEVGWTARLEAELYSTTDAVPESVLREWYEANPHGFSIIRRGESRIGHLNLLPLRPPALRRFLEGRMREREIRGEHLYGPEEREQVSALYVESLAVLPVSAYARAAAVALVVANFMDAAARVCDTAKAERVYAIAASDEGSGLMHRLGFRELDSGAGRLDRHQLLEAKLTDLQAAASSFRRARKAGRPSRRS